MATNSIDIGVALHGFGLADEAFGVLSNSLDKKSKLRNLRRTFCRKVSTVSDNQKNKLPNPVM